VQVGSAELLLSDSERLASLAAKAGVAITLEVGEGLPHVYQSMLGTPEAAEATERIGTFLKAGSRDLAKQRLPAACASRTW
jgi:monoterpene epsilon-lactone hydrolase